MAPLDRHSNLDRLEDQAQRAGVNGRVESLVSEAIALPSDQRLTLAHRILSSVEPDGSPEIDAAWDNDIRERIARYYADGVRSIPASEVFAAIDRGLRK